MYMRDLFLHGNSKKGMCLLFIMMFLIGGGYAWHHLTQLSECKTISAQEYRNLSNEMVAGFLMTFALGSGVLAITEGAPVEAQQSLTGLSMTKAQAQAGAELHVRPILEDGYTEIHPAPLHPVLRWTRVDRAVMYDVQVLAKDEEDRSYRAIMPTQRTYTTGIELALPSYATGQRFYYRVCGLDPEGNPVGAFSEIRSVPLDMAQTFKERPMPISDYAAGNGIELLYPVYDWIPVPGAEQYEVEILNDLPENPEGIRPSVHRIGVYRTASSHQYDAEPRSGKKPIYWRVRAMDAQGKAVGIWSEARAVPIISRGHHEVATFGDSISHGGGSISYSPTEWDFSYQHHLGFATINLAQSGDTAERGRARFDADILPFHPHYLLILMGSNDLRAGTDADAIIADLEWMRQRCLENHIRPVFLTLPPLNPDHIQRAFQTPTADDWQEIRAAVNRYIEAQVHIDITVGMEDEAGNLKGNLALDGLHLDPAGKQMMAQAINAAWPRIQHLPDSAWKNE